MKWKGRPKSKNMVDRRPTPISDGVKEFLSESLRLAKKTPKVSISSRKRSNGPR